MFHIPGCKLLRSRLILRCVLLGPAPNPILCTEQALCKQDLNSINNNNWGAWNDSVILWFHLCCDLLSVTLWFCTWAPVEISQLQKHMGWKNSLPAGKQTHKMHNWSPNHGLFFKKEQWKTIWSPVPLYLVTTAALTLRGSWKLTVSDVLLVTMRQTLVGTSGAPGTEGKTQGS